MSEESSANNSFQEDSKSKDPLTPSIHLTTPPRAGSFSTPGLLNEQQAGSSKFKLFEDTTTPLQRSTNTLNQNVATAPPFLRNPNESSLNSIPADLVDINLAIGALDLDFGAAARSKDKESKAKVENTTADSNENKPEQVANQNHPEHQFGGLVHHQQPFHPFFPINGFGHPLPSPFTPGEPLDGAQHQLPHHQPWPTKPGQIPFGTPIGDGQGLDSLSHTPPIPHPGMIPFRPFDFGPDGLSTPPPHLANGGLIPDVNFNGFNDGSLKDGRAEFHPGNSQVFPNGIENLGPGGHVNFGNRQGLQNAQLWPALNGRPQDFNDGFGLNGIPPNGLRQNNGNDRGFTYFHNGGNNHHHHHNNHHHGGNYNNRRYGGHRKRGEDASRFANAKLEDFVGQIYSLCKDQHGCRFLQKQLDTEESSATVIFEETHPHVIELMMDSFGNYLVQKLLEKVNDEQRLILVKNASVEFVAIALDPHGTRALQKLVECIKLEEEAHIVVESLSGHVVTLSRDLNGNHVIQKCLQRFTYEDSQFIFDAAVDNCLKIATHRHGCCVLQRCLDHGSDEQCQKLSLVVSKIADQLSYDAFGNYVVQYVLAKNDEESVINIVASVKSDIVNLALHKFGSNVIEKCLRTTELGKALIDALLNKEDELVKLLNDSFGNYVLQTSLDVADEEQLGKLSSLLKPLLPQIRNTPHGRRIAARLNAE